MRGLHPRRFLRQTTFPATCCRGWSRQTSLTRNELTGIGPRGTPSGNFANVRDLRRSIKGTLLAYVLLRTSGLLEDSRGNKTNKQKAKCCSRFSEPCPRTQGFVCLKNWYYASRPSWKNSIWLNPHDEKQPHPTQTLLDPVPDFLDNAVVVTDVPARKSFATHGENARAHGPWERTSHR